MALHVFFMLHMSHAFLSVAKISHAFSNGFHDADHISVKPCIILKHFWNYYLSLQIYLLLTITAEYFTQSVFMKRNKFEWI